AKRSETLRPSATGLGCWSASAASDSGAPQSPPNDFSAVGAAPLDGRPPRLGFCSPRTSACSRPIGRRDSGRRPCAQRTPGAAVGSVRLAITPPVQKVSGFAAGVSYAAADFKVGRDWRHAVQAGKEAAARRETDLADELREVGP